MSEQQGVFSVIWPPISPVKKSNNTWEFKVASLSQVNWDKVIEDMGYKNPIAFVELPNDETHVLVHESILYKAQCVGLKTPFILIKSLVKDIKVGYCSHKHRSEWIEWAGMVKGAEWPKDFRNGGIIKVILPNV